MKPIFGQAVALRENRGALACALVSGASLNQALRGRNRAPLSQASRHGWQYDVNKGTP